MPAGTRGASATSAEGSRGAEQDVGESGEEIRPVINVVVRELAPLERFLAATTRRVRGGRERARASAAAPARPTRGDGEQADRAEVGSSMRAAAPPMQSFGRGRRR